MKDPIRSDVTLGVIVGSRANFPAHLCRSGRQSVLKALAGENLQAVILDANATPNEAVQGLADARQCADLFRANRERIDGILVTLPNFGDERAVANSIRMSGLDVPVLVHAFPDEAGQMELGSRRDAFCGKISVCNNLRQYGIPFSLTGQHVVDPASEAFQSDLRQFAGVCRVVGGLRGARLGMIGARPAAFNTVRFSEKILERNRISVETLDLSELFGDAQRIPSGDADLLRVMGEMRDYLPGDPPPAAGLERMARLAVVIERWMADNDLQAVAIQCWRSMQKNYGVVPCLLMSMLSNRLLPAACETDIPGTIGMLALALASRKPSALVDWNNNWGDDPDLGVLFHCSNLPRDLLTDEPAPRAGVQGIMAQSMGAENTWGAVSGRLKPAAVTYCRVTTDDLQGRLRAYVGEGEILDRQVSTFGGYGVMRVPRFQELLKFIIRNGFEHHAAINPSRKAEVLEEAFVRYLGWETYRHE
jgi:L-fucose isomerase-like protein